MDGAVELDESYFGPRRVPGKRGRGASGKTIVFSLFNRGMQVYTEIVPDYSKKTLQAILRGKIDAASMVNTDGWRGYDELVDGGFDELHRAVSFADLTEEQVLVPMIQDALYQFGVTIDDLATLGQTSRGAPPRPKWFP